MVDILAHIFPQCDESSLAVCARVNRCWEEPALRVLWREIYDATPLFRLLGPVKNKPLRFTTSPVAKNWPRFYRYAGWIRSLQLHIISPGQGSRPESTTGIDPGVFRDASLIASALDLPLIPRITSLTVTASGVKAVKSTICLLQPTIRQLNLVLLQAASEYIALPLLAISHRCSLVTDLTLRCGDDVQDGLTLLHEELGDMISSLHHLEMVALSPQIVTYPMVWESLSTRPHLSSLHFPVDNSVRAPANNLDENIVPSPSFEPDSFWELTALDLSIHHTVASALFAEALPPRLNQIDVRLHGAPHSVDIEGILSELAANAPALGNVYVTCLDSRAVLSLEHIQPILVKGLKRLYIQMDTMLELSDHDMLQIARSIPDIQELFLSPDPLHSSLGAPPTLTLRALSSCAQHCPKLVSLALYLDARPEFNRFPPDSRHTFEYLEDLNLGFSPCPSPLHVAIHIAAVTRNCNPTIDSDFLFLRSTRSSEATERLKICKGEWAAVSGMIPVLRDQIVQSWAQKIHGLEERIAMLGGTIAGQDSSSDETSSTGNDGADSTVASEA